MPKNCSADVQAVIKHVDTVFRGKNVKAINAIKENFNMTELKQLDDVSGARTSVTFLVQLTSYAWQRSPQQPLGLAISAT